MAEELNTTQGFTFTATATAEALSALFKLTQKDLTPEDALRLPDTLLLKVSDPDKLNVTLTDVLTGQEIMAPASGLRDFTFSVRTKLTIAPEGVVCPIGDQVITFTPDDWDSWYTPEKTLADLVIERNPEPIAKSLQAFNVHTSQEIDAFLQSTADGKRGDHWTNQAQGGYRVWDGGLAHFVKLTLTPQETDMQDLIALTESQDADSCLIALYTLNALAPESPLAPGLRRGEWLDLLDIARKTGILSREGKQERADAVRKVWYTLLYGARAEVCGQRTRSYYDKKTDQRIDTNLESPVWTFGGRERQAQAVLFDALDIPLRVEVILTKDWERLLFDASLAQYLPCGERIGAIAAGKTSGAWARMIGLALMNTWRREPQKTIYTYALNTLAGPNAPTDETAYNQLETMQTTYKNAGALKITRREILMRYTPSKGTPGELDTPKRAIEYWLQALKHLQIKGIVAKAGEAIRTKKDIERKLPRYNWLDQWLDEPVDIRPGPAILAAIETQARAIPKPKRKVLGPPKTRKKRA